MKYTVHIRHTAENDVTQAQAWYEKQQPGLSQAFHHDFVKTISILETTPLIYQEIYRGVRRALLHRFPYLVWYTVTKNSVIIIACTHGKQLPKRIKATWPN